MPAAVHAVSICEQLMRSMRGSSFGRAMMEAAIVRLAAADKFVDTASLIERLSQLAGHGGPTAAPRTGGSPIPPRPAAAPYGGGYGPTGALKKNR